MERFIEEKEYQACDSMIKLRQIKASIQHCYSSIMAYKGLEGRETNLVKQMEEFGIRLGITMAAIKYVEDEKARNAKDMERHDSGRLPMGRHSCDTGVGSAHGEGDDNSHSVQMGGAASETNRSSNWRPEQAGGCDAAQKFHSRTKRFRQRGGGMSSCGEDTGLVISECSIPTIYDSAKAIHSSTEQNKRTELLPRSTVDDGDCRGRCQRRGCFARSRSFSIEENEAMKPRKGNGLETIREGGCRDTKRAHSTRASSSVSRSPQRVHYPPRPTPNSAASNASIDISFNKSLPDQEFQVSKSGDTKALKHRSRDKYFLPSINPDSAKGSKRNASSTLCCLSENSEMKSGERLLSLSRVSDRVRNQMNNAQRLYYLSSAPEQQFRTLSNGYWEDGVFVPVPQGNTRQRKRSSKISTVSVKEKTVDQVSKSDLKLEEKEKGEDGDNCKTNKSQLPILQVPFKVAVKRFSTSTETLSLKDIDVLQRVISRSGHERQTLDATKELQGYPLDKSKSSATTVDCLQRQPLQTQKSDRDLTSPTRKPSLAKKSSSCKILAKYCSAPVKSLYPPLRQPSIIRQKWRLAEEKASQSPPGRVDAAAHSLNAQKYWTDMYQTQNFKRDCLSILANVKLGSRLP
ncbi:hypothetical protein EGW08_003067 [Elysia chlorotica]|uniref:Uncharacterized protein n=1 Tax=Elysia chlorotica TaxID=188477 RepID=A0A3S1A2V2_ELYCH|nr:hypothetical protein EGW08_003067 [Elysia chlorotica]